MSHWQNAVENYSIKIYNESFENVVKFTNVGITVTNQNYIHEEIKNVSVIWIRVFCLPMF
jgi:hypothetical protein